jgi:Predicted membrane protein (DUF2142)
MARVVALFRDPMRTFVFLAVVVGGYLVFAVPYFGGIDEPAHFSRSYQISTGRFVPEKIGNSKFSGACLPKDVLAEMSGYEAAYFRHLVSLFPHALKPGAPAPASQAPPKCESKGESFVTFSTFGSPVPYLPQAATLFVARELGAGAGGMLVAGRIVLLAVYVAIVAFAIRRSPRARWALCAAALIPVAVFQSASSLSHDAITTAVAILVVSSALRALDPPEGVTAKALVVEAALLSALLGMCKPVYVVIAGLYLLPLLGTRERRAKLWLLAPAAAVGVVVSVVWNQVVGDLWRTDATYFGIVPDPPARRHELLTAPWHFVADALRTVPDQFWEWTKGLFGVGPSVTDWPGIVIGVALAIFVVVALQHDGHEPRPLRWFERGLVLVLFVIGMALVFAANYVYWTTPGNDEISGIQARYFVPLLVLIPLMVGTPRARWLGAREARIPLSLLLVPFFVVFAVSVTAQMR